jgi:hypothetical protein
MRLTRHRLKLAIGVLICAVGLVLCFAPGILFFRLLDGACWLFIGGSFCFVREFNLRFSRDWFTLGLGLFLAVVGVFLTAFAVSTVFGFRPHGLLPFYSFIGIGPLLIFTGVLCAFDKKHAA